MTRKSWALVVPLANEEARLSTLTNKIRLVLDRVQNGVIYYIIDHASHDSTLGLSRRLSASDKRFRTIWEPQNRNIVDAYLRGFDEALSNCHEYIIEMDGGLSHDPLQIPDFLNYLDQGYDCVFGSRFLEGKDCSNMQTSRKRLSQVSTWIANQCLSTNYRDMTSGYQGFTRHALLCLMDYPLRSTAHFYQTEVRYLMRNWRKIEIPIQYCLSDSSLNRQSIVNAYTTLSYYTIRRYCGKEDSILSHKEAMV